MEEERLKRKAELKAKKEVTEQKEKDKFNIEFHKKISSIQNEILGSQKRLQDIS